MMFPRPAWENFRDRVAALPMDSSGWKRVFLGSAMDVEIDASSRVLIAPELRAWRRPRARRDAARHGQSLRTVGRRAARRARSAVMQSALPDSLKSFSF